MQSSTHPISTATDRILRSTIELHMDTDTTSVGGHVSSTHQHRQMYTSGLSMEVAKHKRSTDFSLPQSLYCCNLAAELHLVKRVNYKV